MLSRAEEMEQVYIEMPKIPGKSEKIKFVIKANPHSLQENENLVQRSIVPSYKSKEFQIFMININSLQHKVIDLTKDVYAQMSNHICVVETWLKPSSDYNIKIPERFVSLVTYYLLCL